MTAWIRDQLCRWAHYSRLVPELSEFKGGRSRAYQSRCSCLLSQPRVTEFFLYRIPGMHYG